MTNRKVQPSIIVIGSIVVLALIVCLLPFYYILLQSFLPWDKVDQTFLPGIPTLKSYIYLLNRGGSSDPTMWIRALLNSFIVSTPTAIVSVAVGLMTGYASVHMHYKGRQIIESSLLFQMFFPVIILLVPRYMIVKNLVNTYGGMILPLVVSVWGIFMYINHFKTVPTTVFEAAKIDGASHMRILWSIALPSTKSISIVVFLSIFMIRWNELMWDMLISPGIHTQTLNVMISTQFNQNTNLPGPMYAAAILLSLPIIVLFLCFSKHFKEGINFMLK